MILEYLMASLTFIGFKKMKKLILVLPLLLAACGDNDDEKRIKQLEAQNNQTMHELDQQRQQMAFQQQQMMQQPAPQYQPAPQAPVIVQQPQHDNTIMNMAVGALAGHAISNAMNGSNNDRPVERVVEHKTVIIDNRQPTTSGNNLQSNVSNVPTPSVPSNTKQNYMDMSKLSDSAKYAPPSAPVKSSGMDMSKFSKPSSPSIPVRSSGMNMSKLSSKR